MAQIKLYVWDNAVFVLASSIEEARSLAVARLVELPAMKETVCKELPRELTAPCVHLVFHAQAIL
jgi:hypothetical protein